jgi:DNA polymerase elongation subunit (family B)
MVFKIAYFDLETNSLTWNNEDDRIISCSILDANKDESKFFLINDLNNDSERILLNQIINYLKKFNVWVGYNSWNFDINFLIERIKRLLPALYDTLEPFKFTKFNKKYGYQESRYLLKDYESLDYLELIKFFRFDNLPSYKLSAVSDYYLTDNKIDLGGKLPIELYNNKSFDELKKYNNMDVLLLKKLEVELGLIKLSEELVNLSGCKLYQAIVTSKIAEGYFEKKGIELVDVGKPQYPPVNVKNSGGFVWQTDAGVYHNIDIMDYKSLYPSIILSFNLDPELVPIIKELWDLRASYKHDKIKYTAIKAIINSLYGYYDYSFSKRYMPEIAAEITRLGREIIKWTRDYIEFNSNAKVVLVDTDSCYIMNNTLDVNVINEAVNSHFKTKYPLELELEDSLESIMLIGRKKHYAYKTKNGEYIYKGIAAVKGNTYPILKKLQIETINQLLDGETNFKNINKIIDRKINEASLLDIAIPYNLGKDFTNTTRRSFKADAVNWSKNNINSISNDPNNVFDTELGSKVYIIEVKRGLDYNVQFDKFIAFSYELLNNNDYWLSKFVPSTIKVSKDVKRIVNEILDSVGADTGKGKQKSLFDWG